VDLCEDLNCLPLALSWATAVMRERRLGCREYRQRFATRRNRLGVGYDAAPTVAWTLAIESADRLPPVGMAWPVLVLAAVLDAGGGVPAAALTSGNARAHVGGTRGDEPVIGEEHIADAAANLARLGLVTLDTAGPVPLVRAHAVVRAAVQANLTREQVDSSIIVAAGAAAQAWPEPDAPAPVVQPFRDCVFELHRRGGTLLLVPEIHPALVRAGRSLTSNGLTGSAIAYWQNVIDGAGRSLGADHPSAVAAREELAHAFQRAGNLSEATLLMERVLADRERFGGLVDPETLAARDALVDIYERTGQRDQAIAVRRHGLTEIERALGIGHPATLAARADLAHTFRRAGMVKEAAPVYERTLAERERVLGPDHPDTVQSREEFAAVSRALGRRSTSYHARSPGHDG
jgi:hypothetical protein